MSNDVILHKFPKDECEALAMLYVKNQDLSNLSPEEIYDEYRDAYEKIKNRKQEIRQKAKVQRVSF